MTLDHEPITTISSPTHSVLLLHKMKPSYYFMNLLEFLIFTRKVRDLFCNEFLDTYQNHSR